MKRVGLTILLFCAYFGASAQRLPVAWEELTSGDFAKAVSESGGVCIIPMGVMEKHGQHLPLGTDLYTARDISLKAAQKEYAIVFPAYFAGQIFEAKQQPGTVAYSADLIYKLLDETCREISRNGIKKIILMNSHGGNNNFLLYFCQPQLESARDYAVYLYRPEVDPQIQKSIAALRKSTTGGHADEVESSIMMYIRPDLVKIERAGDESGADLDRLKLTNAYASIWWYGKYPNHYAGDARGANPMLGEIAQTQKIEQLVEVIKQVKADKSAIELQNRFFKEALSPVK
ncbi:MAG: creatininase [Bacteroidetes bacterium HGW-Bacteroidetes-8]|jgi:creatinine amidohydrolase|nr:MAG: creatininase [Bacteroidetes bacterium HGW-Bacteroidetes-8]